MLDSEVLYTVVEGIKPVSCKNLFKLQLIETYPEQPTEQFLAASDDLRQVLSPWKCGESLGIYVLSHPKRTSLCDTYFVNLPALSATIRAHQPYFSALGVTPSSHPMEVLLAVIEKDDNRGPGYLFGYSDYAVDWYEDVVVPQVRATKTWPDLDTMEVPTFAKMTARRTNTGRFMFNWAVPKGHVPNEADRAIFARSAIVFAAYGERRLKHIGQDKSGPFSLLQGWYCESAERCSIDKARPR